MQLGEDCRSKTDRFKILFLLINKDYTLYILVKIWRKNIRNCFKNWKIRNMPKELNLENKHKRNLKFIPGWSLLKGN